jgi:hypothetical protein
MKKTKYYLGLITLTLLVVMTGCQKNTATLTENLLTKFNEQVNLTAVNKTISDYNLGALAIGKTKIERRRNANGIGYEYSLTPVYKNNTINAALLGVYDNQGKYQFWIVEVRPNNTAAKVIYYLPGQGVQCAVNMRDGQIREIYERKKSKQQGLEDATTLASGESGGFDELEAVSGEAQTCVARIQKSCKDNCAAKPNCQSSCDFWNDWFWGSCNKAMWVAAAAKCAGLPEPGGACGGFN